MPDLRFSFSTIRLSAVDMNDDTYRITTDPCDASLTDSVKMLGLMSPPLVIPIQPEARAEGESSPCFRIVSGFRRIAAVQNLGWDETEARVLAPDTVSAVCVKFAIGENSLQRPLNLIETSRSLCLLATVSDAEELPRIAKSLSLPDNLPLIRKIMPLCRLPGPLQNGILSGTLSMPMALELSSPEPREAATDLALMFETLRLSLNKQREVLTLIREIAAREDLSIPDVLNDPNLQEILRDDDRDRNQKARSVRTLLRQRRFPAITRAESVFEKHAGTLYLGDHMKLIPPAGFESSVYTLRMDFSNPDELRSLKIIFDQLIQNPALKKILS